MSFIEFVGYVPAIVFPSATIFQLLHMVKTKTSSGVSPITWSAFFIGNISLYLYTEKYFEVQSILSSLLTSVLQLVIIALIFKYRNNQAMPQPA